MPKADMTSKAFLEGGFRIRGRSGVTDYKADLEEQMRAEGFPEYEREYIFNEKRNWRFDYFFHDERVAVEYEGGIFDKGKGGHTSISGIMRDVEKYNEASLQGILVIRTHAQTVANREAVRLIYRALERQRCAKIAADGRVVEDTKRTLKGLLKRLE